MDGSFELHDAFEKSEDSLPLSQEPPLPRRSSIRPMERKSVGPQRRISWATTAQYKKIQDDGTAAFGIEELKNISFENKSDDVKTPESVDKENLENLNVPSRPVKDKYLSNLLAKYYKPTDIDDCVTIMRTAMNKLSNLDSPQESFLKFMEIIKGCPILSKNGEVLKSFLIEFLNMPHFSLQEAPLFLKLLETQKINIEEVPPEKLLETTQCIFNSTKVVNSTVLLGDMTNSSFRNCEITPIFIDPSEVKSQEAVDDKAPASNQPEQVVPENVKDNIEECSMTISKTIQVTMSSAAAPALNKDDTLEFSMDISPTGTEQNKDALVTKSAPGVSDLSMFQEATSMDITLKQTNAEKSLFILETKNITTHSQKIQEAFATEVVDQENVVPERKASPALVDHMKETIPSKVGQSPSKASANEDTFEFSMDISPTETEQIKDPLLTNPVSGVSDLSMFQEASSMDITLKQTNDEKSLFILETKNITVHSQKIQEAFATEVVDQENVLPEKKASPPLVDSVKETKNEEATIKVPEENTEFSIFPNESTQNDTTLKKTQEEKSLFILETDNMTVNSQNAPAKVVTEVVDQENFVPVPEKPSLSETQTNNDTLEFSMDISPATTEQYKDGVSSLSMFQDQESLLAKPEEKSLFILETDNMTVINSQNAVKEPIKDSTLNDQENYQPPPEAQKCFENNDSFDFSMDVSVQQPTQDEQGFTTIIEGGSQLSMFQSPDTFMEETTVSLLKPAEEKSLFILDTQNFSIKSNPTLPLNETQDRQKPVIVVDDKENEAVPKIEKNAEDKENDDALAKMKKDLLQITSDIKTDEMESLSLFQCHDSVASEPSISILKKSVEKSFAIPDTHNISELMLFDSPSMKESMTSMKVNKKDDHDVAASQDESICLANAIEKQTTVYTDLEDLITKDCEKSSVKKDDTIDELIKSSEKNESLSESKTNVQIYEYSVDFDESDCSTKPKYEPTKPLLKYPMNFTETMEQSTCDDILMEVDKEPEVADKESSNESLKRHHDVVEKDQEDVKKDMSSNKVLVTEDSFSKIFSPVKSPEFRAPKLSVADLKNTNRTSLGTAKLTASLQPLFPRKSIANFVGSKTVGVTNVIKPKIVVAETKPVEIEIDFNKTAEKSHNQSSVKKDVKSRPSFSSQFLRQSLGFNFHEKLLQKAQKALKKNGGEDVCKDVHEESKAKNAFEELKQSLLEESNQSNITASTRADNNTQNCSRSFLDASKNDKMTFGLETSIEQGVLTCHRPSFAQSFLMKSGPIMSFDETDNVTRKVNTTISNDSLINNICKDRTIDNESRVEEVEEDKNMEVDQSIMDISNVFHSIDSINNSDDEARNDEFELALTREESNVNLSKVCDPNQSICNFTALLESDDTEQLDDTNEKLLNFTISPFDRVLEELQNEDEVSYLKIDDVKNLNLRVQHINNDGCEIHLLWGTFHVRIFFGDVIDEHSGARRLSMDTYSVAYSKPSECFDTLLCKKDEPKFFNDISLDKIYRDEHLPLLIMAHDYFTMRLHEREKQLVQKYSDSSKLLNLIQEVVDIGNEACKLYLEIRNLYSDNFFFQILDRDSEGRFCFVRKIGGFDDEHFINMIIAFDFHKYPYEVIHPQIVVPPEHKDVYLVDEIFKPCLLMIKPGNDNYLTKLVKASNLVVKAIKMEIYENLQFQKQKAEMCPSTGSQKIARSP